MYLTLFSFTGIAMLSWLMLIFLPTWRVTKKIAELEIFPVYLAVLYVVGIVPLLMKQVSESSRTSVTRKGLSNFSPSRTLRLSPGFTSLPSTSS